MPKPGSTVSAMRKPRLVIKSVFAMGKSLGKRIWGRTVRVSPEQ
jgi:hypothetical protein|tara:strand:+ start:245 stop:376 length:132 start_codon:yes stop_codon:yes gene_type:complete